LNIDDWTSKIVNSKQKIVNRKWSIENGFTNSRNNWSAECGQKQSVERTGRVNDKYR